MPLKGNPLSRRYSPDEIINVLYNVGFRLTGSHRATNDLVIRALDKLNGRGIITFSTALKGLCSVYIKTAAKAWDPALYRDNCGQGKVEEALLSLPRHERLIVVLRELLGLDYETISEVTGLAIKDVSRLLAAGRSCLVKQLHPLAMTQNYDVFPDAFD